MALSSEPDPYRKPMKPEPKLYVIRTKNRIDDETGGFGFCYFPGDASCKRHDPREAELGDYDTDWVYIMGNPKDASAFTYGGAMVALMWLDLPKDYIIVARRDYVDKFIEPADRAFWHFPIKKKETPKEAVPPTPPVNPFLKKPAPAVNPFKTKPKEEVTVTPPQTNNPFKSKPSPKKPTNNPFLKK